MMIVDCDSIDYMIAKTAGVCLLFLACVVSGLHLHTSSPSHLKERTLHFDTASASPSRAPSQAQLKAYRQQFDAIDSNNNSMIEASEMRDLMQRFDSSFTDKQAEEIVNEADLDDSGDLDFHEYVQQIFEPPPPPPPTPEELEQMARDKFDQYDEDQDGKISFAEFKDTVRGNGWIAPDDQYRANFDQFDPNNDGEITFLEFHH